MKIDVIIYAVLFVLLVAFMSYKWFVKKEKQWCKDVLIKLQKMAEDYFGTKAGQQKLKTVLEKMNGIIDKRLAHSSSFTRWIIKKALNEYVVKKLIEENMDEVNKYGAERKEKELIKSAIDFGIQKGTELLIKEAYNHDVDGNKELTHETQLMTIAQDLNVQAKDKGFVGAYAEFETNFKEEKRLSAGITAGMKF